MHHRGTLLQSRGSRAPFAVTRVATAPDSARIETADAGRSFEAIREGGGGFVAELVTGRNLDDHVHAWADPRERQVGQEFRAAMDGRAFGRWLGNGGEGWRPPALGYYVGCRIAKARYDRPPDERRAEAGPRR